MVRFISTEMKWVSYKYDCSGVRDIALSIFKKFKNEFRSIRHAYPFFYSVIVNFIKKQQKKK